MPSYSGDQFYKDWVYAIKKDFHSSDGTPASWAEGQPQQWHRDEHASTQLPSKAGPASLNADESLIAVAVEHDILIYNTDTENLRQVQALKGHLSRVDALYFHPKNPNVLVSCAMNYMGGSVPAEPQILFWDLQEQREHSLLPEDVSSDLGEYAAEMVADRLRDKDVASRQHHPWILEQADKDVLTKDFSKAITAQNISSQVQHNFKLDGRLNCSFGSQVFNSSGTSLAFLPGKRPKSNGDDGWDVCIYDLPTKTVRLTLVGHRDAIMWTGFSPDDKYIATVCWDQTFRIWSHATGELLHTFRSESQNWTGAFSHDSRFFAATDGGGHFYAWDLAHGVEVVSASASVDERSRWCRTMDWSPDDKQLVIGSGHMGQVLVYDVKRQEVVQKRVLSKEKSAEPLRKMVSGFLEVGFVKYVQDSGTYGRKIVSQVSSDKGVEIYDVDENRKWRFAPREGVDEGWGGDVLILENKGLIASVNQDFLRFWVLPAKQRVS